MPLVPAALDSVTVGVRRLETSSVTGALTVTAEVFFSVAVVSKVLVSRLKISPERLTVTRSDTSADQAGPTAKKTSPTSTSAACARSACAARPKIVMLFPLPRAAPCRR